jgi:hypothetical protein
MNQHAMSVLESQRAQVESFLKHGTCRGMHLKAIYNAATEFGMPTSMCAISPDHKELKIYLERVYERYNQWLRESD